MNWNWSSCWKWGSEVPSHDATSVGLITTLTSELATEACNQLWQKWATQGKPLKLHRNKWHDSKGCFQRTRYYLFRKDWSNLGTSPVERTAKSCKRLKKDQWWLGLTYHCLPQNLRTTCVTSRWLCFHLFFKHQLVCKYGINWRRLLKGFRRSYVHPIQPLLLGAAFIDPMASWHRPWESTRDRSTFALGFSSALVTDVFVELSRTDDGKMLGKMVGNPPKTTT